MSKRSLMLLSIVERDKGKKLIKELENLNIRVNFQCVGLGTAPTEMMDIFGLGTKDKDVIISLGSENAVKDMMANFGTTFESHSKYGGLMIILKLAAAGRILTEILCFNDDKISEKGNGSMKNVTACLCTGAFIPSWAWESGLTIPIIETWTNTSC